MPVAVATIRKLVGQEIVKERSKVSVFLKLKQAKLLKIIEKMEM